MVGKARLGLLTTIAIGMVVVSQLAQAQVTPELIEAAKKEGEVMFYGAITVNSSKAIGDAFEKSTVSSYTIGAATPLN